MGLPMGRLNMPNQEWHAKRQRAMLMTMILRDKHLSPRVGHWGCRTAVEGPHAWEP